MGDLTTNFSSKEFECKCGCGFSSIGMELVRMCQRVRDIMGEPVRINSACRCTMHNKKEGGVQKSSPIRGGSGKPEDSFHTVGKAVDLSCDSGGKKLFVVIMDLFEAGEMPQLAYCKFYIKKNFVHIDVGSKRNQRFVQGN